MKKQVSQAIMQAVVDKVAKTLDPSSSSKQQSRSQPKSMTIPNVFIETGRKKKNRKGSRPQTFSHTDSHLRMNTSLNTIGATISNNTFDVSGRPQQVVGHDPRHGVRVGGSSLFQVSAAADGTTAKGFKYGSLYYYWIPLTATFVDVRLAAYWSIYDLYAFRRVKITYIPASSSNATDMLAYGIAEDYTKSDVVPSPNQTQILALPSSVLNSVWQPSSITCTCNGTDLFETSSNVQNSQRARIQLGVGACFEGIPTVGLRGKFLIEWVCDLYSPSIPSTLINSTPPEYPPSKSSSSTPSHSIPEPTGQYNRY